MRLEQVAVGKKLEVKACRLSLSRIFFKVDSHALVCYRLPPGRMFLARGISEGGRNLNFERNQFFDELIVTVCNYKTFGQ